MTLLIDIHLNYLTLAIASFHLGLRVSVLRIDVLGTISEYIDFLANSRDFDFREGGIK